MKRSVFSIILIVVLLFSSVITAFADGDGNIDNGGGDMGNGTSQNSWTPGNEGVRVTVVDSETEKKVGKSIDYTDLSPASSIVHFGKVSKLQYRNGSSLSPEKGGYYFKNPTYSLPKIISTGSSSASIEAIKKYFCSEGAAQMIANDTGLSYEKLTNGSYKLLLEPIAYFKYQGIQMGMTAHEAAMYDQIQNGDLRRKMVSLTHKNLPLAMFLERSDLGFPAWNGSSTSKQTNTTILKYLGIGVVSYKEAPPVDPVDISVIYRINTQVITSVTLNALSEINPDSPATVTFNVGGGTYTMSNIVIPEGESQLVWCKWTTPATEQSVTITVRSNKGYLSENVIKAKIVDLGKNLPPNPTANDRNDSFRTPNISNKMQKTYSSWSTWWAQWHPYWVWISNWNWCDHGEWGHWVDNGWWEDHGWYDFFTDVYSASLNASSTVSPDIKSPTASGKTMKSGYGINNKVQTVFSTSAPSSHVSAAQTAVSYFPEFEYNTYWRLLDLIGNGYSSQFEFKLNPYSTYKQRSHFTPVWYPNGQYRVYTYVQDAWTPAGMLCLNLNDDVTISGSLYDDWHIAPKQ